MEVHLTPERSAQLNDYAQRHGQDPSTALDDALAVYLEEERLDFQRSLEAVRRGYEDIKAGRTRPASEFLEEVREKHGFPRFARAKQCDRDLGL